jgi:hypothetical protein
MIDNLEPLSENFLPLKLTAGHKIIRKRNASIALKLECTTRVRRGRQQILVTDRNRYE